MRNVKEIILQKIKQERGFYDPRSLFNYRTYRKNKKIFVYSEYSIIFALAKQGKLF